MQRGGAGSIVGGGPIFVEGVWVGVGGFVFWGFGAVGGEGGFEHRQPPDEEAGRDDDRRAARPAGEVLGEDIIKPRRAGGGPNDAEDEHGEARGDAEAAHFRLISRAAGRDESGGRGASFLTCLE